MGFGLILGEEDAVPRGPFFILIPTDQDQIIEILPGAKGTLGIPDINHQVAQVSLLHRQGKKQKTTSIRIQPKN